MSATTNSEISREVTDPSSLLEPGHSNFCDRVRSLTAGSKENVMIATLGDGVVKEAQRPSAITLVLDALEPSQ